MKIIYTQDFHISGRNNINYIGDYFKDCLEMIDEIICIAKKENIDLWIDGGDFLDSVEIENHLLDQILDKIEQAKINFKYLYGNHCMYFRNKSISNLKSSMAHAERRSKYFQYFNILKKDNFEIRQIDYYHDIETDLKEGKHQEKLQFENEKNWNIVLIHAFIYDKKFPFASHIIYKDIQTNANLILVSHVHKQWSGKNSKTEFVDIGNLGRRSITEANIEPSCVLLDTEKRSHEIIKLKSAKKGSEVFDLEKYKDEKQKDANIDDFIKSLESVDFQSSKIEDIISKIAKEQNIDKEVVELIIKRMESLK